jgi:hypothetical protein
MADLPSPGLGLIFPQFKSMTRPTGEGGETRLLLYHKMMILTAG